MSEAKPLLIEQRRSPYQVNESTTGDATTPFDRRRDGLTFWPSLCSIRVGVSVSVHQTLLAQPRLSRYGTAHHPSTHPSIKP